MQDETRKSVLRYVVAVVAVAGALLGRFLLDPSLGDHLPFVTFFVAVVIASWYGGLRAGSWRPRWASSCHSSSSSRRATRSWGLGAYLVVSLAITAFGEAMRAAQRRSRRDQQAASEQQEWLRATLASIGDAVIATDAGGKVIFLNDVARALTGVPPASNVRKARSFARRVTFGSPMSSLPPRRLRLRCALRPGPDGPRRSLPAHPLGVAALQRRREFDPARDVERPLASFELEPVEQTPLVL
jgi:PAS domain-containing protein